MWLKQKLRLKYRCISIKVWIPNSNIYWWKLHNLEMNFLLPRTSARPGAHFVLNSDDGLLLTWVTTHYEHYPSYSHYFGNTYLVLFWTKIVRTEIDAQLFWLKFRTNEFKMVCSSIGCTSLKQGKGFYQCSYTNNFQ